MRDHGENSPRPAGSAPSDPHPPGPFPVLPVGTGPQTSCWELRSRKPAGPQAFPALSAPGNYKSQDARRGWSRGRGRRARLNSLHRPFCRRSRSAASSLASSPPSPPPLPPPPPSPLPASSRLPPPLSLQQNPSPGAKHLLIYFRFLATAAS